MAVEISFSGTTTTISIARKEYQCERCKQAIHKGEQYVRFRRSWGLIIHIFCLKCGGYK